MVDFLIATAIAAASVSAAYPPATPIADADPAIWVVNDADTVIYLFGTFHALDGKSVWFNDEVETAFERSDELVLETIVPEGPRSASAPLQDSRRAAEASGKPVEGLESFDYQLGMFGRMSQQPAQTVAPAQDLSSAGNLAIVMGQMQAAWNRGDSAIFATMLDQMRANSPASYDVMFTQRNRNWASWIAQRLQKPGIVFVAVGTGHLASPDSVQAKLAEFGVRSARIN